MEAVKVKNLTFSYPESDNNAIESLTLSVARGSFCLIIGESGSGKTTLLKLLKKEIAPKGNISGEILIDEVSADSVSFDRIGFVAQSSNGQIATDKVWHELAFGLENMGLSSEEIRQRVGETASYFGIGKWYHQSTDTLSGGQKQLLNLASCMVMRPEILLLDEPTAQLDPIAASSFLTTLKKINEELGVTVIITEHRLEEVFPLADSVAVLKKGRLEAVGTPDIICHNLSDNPLFDGFPTAARIWKGLGKKGQCPLTVKAAKDYLLKHFPTLTGKTTITEQPRGDIAVEIKNVYFRYERESNDILNEISLNVYKNEIFAILGENGCGKSTALRVIAGLEHHYYGSIKLFGNKIKTHRNNSLYRGTVALLPQDPTLLFAGDTVIDDLKTYWKLSGEKESNIKNRADDLIKLFGIEEILTSHPYDLSGGEQQKCAMVKLLLHCPEILLLDEPTKGLDAAFKGTLCDILITLKNRGITIVIVTHDVEFAAEVADRCGLLFDGKILSASNPNTFFSNNSYYTTAAARIAHGRFENTVRSNEILKICKENDIT